jgi:hypothetical protein
MDKLFGVMGAIVTIGLVFTVVSNPNSAAVITSAGNAFAHSIASAQGRSQ